MRIAWVDISKGIGILLVVAGHSQITGLLNGAIEKWIISFHMPLFFFLAGYCFNATRYPHFFGVDGYCVRKLKALAYPYVMLSIFMAALSVLFYYGNNPSMSFLAQLKYLLHGSSRISPFWFLRILLIVELACWFVAQIQYRHPVPLLCCGCVVAIYLVPNMGPDLIPLRKIINGLLFYLLGSVSKNILSKELPFWALGLSTIVFFLGHFALLLWDYSNVSFFAAKGTGDQLLRIIVSVFGILSVVFLSKVLDRTAQWASKGLSWLGINSIILLAIHGHCGVFRHSWTGMPGWLSFALNLCLVSVLMWLLATKLSFMVKYPKSFRLSFTRT